MPYNSEDMLYNFTDDELAELMLLQEELLTNNFKLRQTTNYNYPKIEKIIYNFKNPKKPATIVFWKDGTKTIAVCKEGEGDSFQKEFGVAMCYMKKIFSSRGDFLRKVGEGYEQR